MCEIDDHFRIIKGHNLIHHCSDSFLHLISCEAVRNINAFERWGHLHGPQAPFQGGVGLLGRCRRAHAHHGPRGRLAGEQLHQGLRREASIDASPVELVSCLPRLGSQDCDKNRHPIRMRRAYELAAPARRTHWGGWAGILAHGWDIGVPPSSERSSPRGTTGSSGRA